MHHQLAALPFNKVAIQDHCENNTFGLTQFASNPDAKVQFGANQVLLLLRYLGSFLLISDLVFTLLLVHQSAVS